jgi:hypothetical protein
MYCTTSILESSRPWWILKGISSNKVLQQLDEQLQVIKTKFGFFGYRIPGNNKGGYFTSNANFATFKHCAVMQVKYITTLFFSQL